MDLTISYLSLTCPQKAAPFPHPRHNQGYVDLERASLIRKTFELYGTGNYSLRETTSLVNREGLRTRKGYRLSKSTAEKILKDPIYCGDFRWDGRV